MGRVNYRNNFKVYQGVNPSSLNFVLIQGGGSFSLKLEHDESGRLFGVLSVNNAQAVAKIGEVPITIELRNGNKVIESKSSTVRIVDETLMAQFQNKVYEYVIKESRLSSRNKCSKKEAKEYFKRDCC